MNSFLSVGFISAALLAVAELPSSTPWVTPDYFARPGELQYRSEPKPNNWWMAPCQFSNDPEFREIVPGRYDGANADDPRMGDRANLYKGPDGYYRYCRAKESGRIEFTTRHHYYWTAGRPGAPSLSQLALGAVSQVVASHDDRLAIIQYRGKRDAILNKAAAEIWNAKK